MKSFLSFLVLFVTMAMHAQIDTEIYLFDLNTEDDKIKLSNQRNISYGDGYDNQPYFLAKNALLYSGTKDGNTEIIKHVRGTNSVFNEFTSGGEYSPQVIPNDRAISAVRLDEDGKQQLYRYKPRNNETKAIVTDAVIAYYTWANANTIVSATIVDEKLHLVIYNLLTNESDDRQILVGRSFHKIPSSDLVSFIDKSNPEWVLKSINPITKRIKTITTLPKGVEDIAWLPDGTLLFTFEDSVFF